MLLIVGTFRLPADAVVTAKGAMEAMMTASRAEDGCFEYGYAEDVLEAGLFHVTERWRDRAALDAHFQTRHMAEWRAAGQALGLADRALSLYVADEGEAL